MSEEGYYLYVEASYPAKSNDTMRILSPPFSESTGSFSVWYHMFGVDTGSLNIYVRTDNRSTIPIFHVQGDQGDVWQEFSMNINNSFFRNRFKQFIIEGVVGDGYLSQWNTLLEES